MFKLYTISVIFGHLAQVLRVDLLLLPAPQVKVQPGFGGVTGVNPVAGSSAFSLQYTAQSQGQGEGSLGNRSGSTDQQLLFLVLSKLVKIELLITKSSNIMHTNITIKRFKCINYQKIQMHVNKRYFFFRKMLLTKYD